MNMMKKFLSLFFLFSFLLNFVWEVTQAPLYTATGLGTRNIAPFIAIRWWVSFGDAFTILAAYLITSVIFRNKRWIAETILGPWVVFFSGLVAWQAGVEYFSVYVWHRWAYGAFMPTIFGIGISPLLQMLILPWIAVILSRKYLTE